MAMILDGLTLPEGLIWVNEFDWTPIEQNQTRSVTGANIIQSGVKTEGRSIILEGGESAAWINRQGLISLQNKLSNDAVMVLTLEDSTNVNVKFDHERTPLLADPIIEYQLPDNEDPYTLTINLITV